MGRSCSVRGVNTATATFSQQLLVPFLEAGSLSACVWPGAVAVPPHDGQASALRGRGRCRGLHPYSPALYRAASASARWTVAGSWPTARLRP